MRGNRKSGCRAHYSKGFDRTGGSSHSCSLFPPPSFPANTNLPGRYAVTNAGGTPGNGVPPALLFPGVSCILILVNVMLRKILTLCVLLAALLAARCFAWAEAAELPMGALASVNLDAGAQTFRFTTTAGSVYDICAFPGEGAGESFSAKLYQDGKLLAQGEGRLTLISQRLSADTEYTVTLSGAGRARLEVARHALSRCFDQPLSLNAAGDSYAKAIARAGDVHWYAVTAPQSQPVALVGLPQEPGLRLEARLFSESGALLAEATRTSGGAFLADFMARSGRAYRIRVSAVAGGTGMYSLNAAPLDGSLPEAVILSDARLRLSGHETRRLTAAVTPEGSAGALFWESSDASVVSVDQTGAVTGLRAGTAVVTAYAAGAVRARCRVEVALAPVSGIDAITTRIDMHAGDDVALEWRVQPVNASETGVTFSAEPSGVVSVDDAGVVRALSEGEAVITLRTVDGGYEDRVRVRVSPAQRRWRALLIGEKNYAPQVAAPRTGSANSVAGVRSMLNGLSYSGTKFQVTTRLDVTRQGALDAIVEAFAGASEQDTSLVYITCHGYYSNGMTCFQMVDGSVLTALELRRALDAVPGALVVLADCCGSGGVIGRAGSPEDMLRGISAVFGGALGPSVFADSRYRVLASASVEQESYRISFETDAVETSMATAFARALCEGCGWSIERSARGAMRADLNADSVVTLDELARYAARRVTWYLSLNDGDYAQTVRAFPEGDVTSLFERTGP